MINKLSEIDHGIDHGLFCTLPIKKSVNSSYLKIYMMKFLSMKMHLNQSYLRVIIKDKIIIIIKDIYENKY